MRAAVCGRGPGRRRRRARRSREARRRARSLTGSGPPTLVLGSADNDWAGALLAPLGSGAGAAVEDGVLRVSLDGRISAGRHGALAGRAVRVADPRRSRVRPPGGARARLLSRPERPSCCAGSLPLGAEHDAVAEAGIWVTVQMRSTPSSARAPLVIGRGRGTPRGLESRSARMPAAEGVPKVRARRSRRSGLVARERMHVPSVRLSQALTNIASPRFD
jgi:hypothetical protein